MTRTEFRRVDLTHLVRAFLIGAIVVGSVAAQVTPKRELRGAWIATVTNLDWPSSFAAIPDPTFAKGELIALLDALKNAGINAVVFQIRPECDALYASPIEPWSRYLTGTQGTAPLPWYDPLEFAIEEAHKRGMELHAWFNPYRSVRIVGAYTIDSTHVSVRHPEWTLTIGTFKFLNPGLPEVRDYVTSVIMDVTRRYRIDGIHWDDYFYPYPPDDMSTNEGLDDAAFAADPRGFATKGEWRRDNINRLVRQVYDSVQSVKPYVKFGISPFGIWKNGIPQGTGGMNAYSAIYCDAMAWLQGQYIDYLTPQLYWPFGGGQDYGLLQPWWADSVAAYGRHFYSGNATYRIGLSTFGPAAQLQQQIKLNQSNPKVQGSVQFRANYIKANIDGWTDLMKQTVFRYPAAVPSMSWKESDPPNMPQNLRIDSSGSNYVLAWDPPSPAAADGDTAARYLVYRFPGGDTSQTGSARNLIALEGQPLSTPPSRIDTPGVQYSFAVSALDKNNNESPLSNIVALSGAIEAPSLFVPANSQILARGAVSLRWMKPAGAVSFLVQTSSSPGFPSDSLIVQIDTKDTLAGVAVQPQQTYYWRVAAGGQTAASMYGGPFSFTTGWPLNPTPVSPAYQSLNIPRNPLFSWTKGGGTSFRAVVSDFLTNVTVLDTTVTDTSFTSSRTLGGNTVFRWRVQAMNSYGSSDWSTESTFKTEIATLVEESGVVPETFDLGQNYPNPFNPDTRIPFSLPEQSRAILSVYDILGREVAVLLNENLAPGFYSVAFDAGRLPSGTYIAVLRAGGFRAAKKMLLVK